VYNFEQYNDVISTYIEVLINNSKTNFQQQIRNGQVKKYNNTNERL